MYRKLAGRGAYLCPRVECWAEALKKNRVAHALKVGLTPEDGRKLLEYSRTLKQGDLLEG